MKILAVDDDVISLNLLKDALSTCGYNDVRQCQSAAEAFEILLSEKTPFDCFLFDIQMPGMNGIDLCKEVRAIDKYKRTPIVMVTAMSEKSFVDRAFSAGATDYVTKPFDPLEISVRLGLAEELASERKFLNESTDVIESLIEELDKSTRRDLEEPIDIGKVNRVLNYPAFENYLFQLSRGVFFLTSIFAVKVNNVKDIHEKLPPLEFREFLARSASAITSRLHEHEVFLAYRGNGVFVGVMQRSGARLLKESGNGIKIDTYRSEDDHAPGLPTETNLIFGDPVVSKILTKPGSLRYLYTAIESAEGKQDVTERSDIPAATTEAQDNQQERLRQKLDLELQMREEYAEFLKDTLSEELDANYLETARNSR